MYVYLTPYRPPNSLHLPPVAGHRPVVRRTKAEAEATRSALLDAAERVFHARGVSRTTLQDIASAAGVTRGAVYWHFRDKADLFNAMMDRVKLPLDEVAARLDECAAHEPLACLRELLCGTLEHIATEPQVRRVFEVATHRVEYVDDLMGVRERHQQAVHEHLATIERVLGRARVPKRHAIGLHALVVGLIHAWMLEPGAFDLVAEGRRAIDVHLAGLKK